VAGELSPPWFSGRNDIWIFREVALAAGISQRDYESRYSDLEAAYLKRLRTNMAGWEGRRILPGVADLLERLSNHTPSGGGSRLDMGLVTGNLEGGARIKLDAFGLNGYFPGGGFGSDAIERREIALIARRRFEKRRGAEIPSGDVVLIGDTVNDAAAARACNYRSVCVATGTTPLPELAATGADLILPDLSDPEPLFDLLTHS
jgi:phosphoglycolate phosphatase-like HAD superfamily hydrolase